MLHAPRVYLSSDVDPIRNRGESQPICATATALVVNPAHHRVHANVRFEFKQHGSIVPVGHVVVNHRRFSVPTTEPRTVRLALGPGITPVHLRVDTPHTRCASAQTQELATVSVQIPV
jgi:hypothetical protein